VTPSETADHELLLSGGTGTTQNCAQAGFIPIPLQRVTAASLRGIDVYLRNGGQAQRGSRYALYRGRNVPFTESDRQRLLQDESRFIYIRIADHQQFRAQSATALDSLAGDDSRARAEKAAIVYETSIELVNDLLSAPEIACQSQRLHEVSRAVAHVVINDPDAFKHLFAAAHHDFYTGTHMVNVGTWMVPLAYALGWCDPDELAKICQAGMLHDIGKLFVPEEILNHCGPLSAEDWEHIRRHPDLGRKHLQDQGALDALAASVCAQHHERVDGSGYPAGLRYARIDPVARLCAVVDSFDAMTAIRPFKKTAIPPADAVHVLKSEAATKYDAQVVEAWIHLVRNLGPDLAGHPHAAPPPQHDGPERRRHPRSPCAYAARVHVMKRGRDARWHKGTAIDAHVHSISEGGLGLLCPVPLRISRRVRVSLETDNGEPRHYDGHVVRCRAYPDGHHEIGIQFLPERAGLSRTT
jgi:HD-GYP domain-containing protein (c-di-GMP phosphodiesterase class II)